MIVKVRDSLIDMMLHLLGFYVMHGSVCSSRFGGAMVCLRWSGSYDSSSRGTCCLLSPRPSRAGTLTRVLFSLDLTTHEEAGGEIMSLFEVFVACWIRRGESWGVVALRPLNPPVPQVVVILVPGVRNRMSGSNARARQICMGAKQTAPWKVSPLRSYAAF